MVMDSLRYWVDVVPCRRLPLRSRVDARPRGARLRSRRRLLRCDAPGPGAVAREADRRAWDLGPGGYQLGNHPPGFAEWNDRFRDGVRRFWRGDAGQRPEFAARLAGSADLFDRRGRRPWASINFVAAHDGFTLADLVSYAERHNEANGEDNRDGHDENYSANWGVEGPTDDPAIRDTRAACSARMLATLFLSQGTPMLLAGDEFGRTQRGNNNAYCQDNETLLARLEPGRRRRGQALHRFVARLIALRQRASGAALPPLPARQATSRRRASLDIAWFDATARSISSRGLEQSGGAHAGAAPRRRAMPTARSRS